MGKQPTTGQKKTKESIARAALASRKGSKKKWSSGKVKDKLVHSTLLSTKQFKEMEKEVPKMKLITISGLTERFKVIASTARKVIRHFAGEGKIKALDFQHQQCPLYTGLAEKKAVESTKVNAK